MTGRGKRLNPDEWLFMRLRRRHPNLEHMLASVLFAELSGGFIGEPYEELRDKFDGFPN